MNALTLATLLSISGCALNAADPGTPGTSVNTHPNVPGTIFTIVFENEAASDVIVPENGYFYQLAHSSGLANAYISNVHPSLPNYIEMTSGSTQNIGNDNDPTDTTDQVAGSENLADQLDAAAIQWRAYGQTMSTPCNMTSTSLYAAHHLPWLYYSSMSTNASRCNDRVVDFDQSFSNDLATGAYRYMWITPNMCDDMHNCSADIVEPWLENLVAEIQASDSYQNGGAIFILFDEGSVRTFGAAADLPVMVLSPNLVTPNYQSETTFNHASYLATVEDILDLPRLATTTNATPMDEFFVTQAAH